MTRRTRTIGLIVPAVSYYGPTSIAMHSNIAARRSVQRRHRERGRRRSGRPGYLFSPLTTVRQDFATLGELMMQKVLISVEEPDSVTDDTPIATHLIVRLSTRAVERPASTAAIPRSTARPA